MLKQLTCHCLALAWALVAAAQEPAPVSVDIESNPRVIRADVERAHKRARNEKRYKLRVRYVKIEGHWASHTKLPLAAGDVLTPEMQSAAINALHAAITANTIQGYGYRFEGEIRVVYIDVEYDTSSQPAPGTDTPPPRNSVGVTFRVMQVALSLVKIGDNVLPVPRSVQPTFYENVPHSLLALRPTFGATYDRAFGFAFRGGIATDLLNIADPSKIRDDAQADRHLDFHAQGSKSVEDSFYRADTGLRYSVRRMGTAVHEFSLRAGYGSVEQPLGDDQETGNSGAGGVSVTFKLAPSTRLSLDTGYQREDDSLRNDRSGISTHTAANEQLNRILFETIPPRIHGFLRAAVWEDNGWQTGAGGAYQQLVGRVGYAKEIAVSQNQTIGLEVVAGAGRSWGDVPGSSLFFGGNSTAQFLYDSPSSLALTNLPPGTGHPQLWRK